MARGTRQVIQGSVVLDSQGMSLLLSEDERMIRRVEKARSESFHVVISAITILETEHARLSRPWRDFVLSRLHIETLTRELTMYGAQLLHNAGMRGHQHAIDSAVAATALRQVRPVLLYTSDPDDMAALCAEPERPKDERVVIIRV